MTQPLSSVPDSTVPENEQSISLGALANNIRELLDRKSRLEGELATTNQTITTKMRSTMSRIEHQVWGDLRDLKKRMLALGAKAGEENVIILQTGNPEVPTIEYGEKENTFASISDGTVKKDSEVFRNRSIGVIDAPMWSGVSVTWDGKYTLAVTKAVMTETASEADINEHNKTHLVLEYPRILAWFQEQLTKIEETKGAKKLAADIMKGE